MDGSLYCKYEPCSSISACDAVHAKYAPASIFIHDIGWGQILKTMLYYLSVLAATETLWSVRAKQLYVHHFIVAVRTVLITENIAAEPSPSAPCSLRDPARKNKKTVGRICQLSRQLWLFEATIQTQTGKTLTRSGMLNAPRRVGLDTAMK